jgi:hypothetical protein
MRNQAMAIVSGYPQQASINLGLYTESAYNRHEQTNADQRNEVIHGKYQPLEKDAPSSGYDWYIQMRKDPASFGLQVNHLAKRIDLLAAQYDALSKKETAESVLRQCGNALQKTAAIMFSVPDNGGGEKDQKKAIRMPSNTELSASQPDRESEKNLDQYLKLQQVIDLNKKTAMLDRYLCELMSVLMMANHQSEAPESFPAHLKKTLDDELLKSQGYEDEYQQKNAPFPTLNENDASNLKNQLAKLKTHWERLGATQNKQRDEIQNLKIKIEEADEQVFEELLNKLPGLEALSEDRKSVFRDFIRNHPPQEKYDFNSDKANIPKPLLTEIYLAALVQTVEKPSALNKILPQAIILNDYTHKKILEKICGFSGGLSSYEQMTGEKIKDPERRVALRVNALAAASLSEIEGISDDNVKSIHRDALTCALRHAKIVMGNPHSTVDSSDNQKAIDRACYNAVRNNFFLSPQPHNDVDPTLRFANNRLEKMRTKWIHRTVKKTRVKVKVRKNKTPFDGKTLRLANRTSHLGYDTTARPMKRLDSELIKVEKELGKFVAILTPLNGTHGTPIGADDLLRLGVIKLFKEKNNERPGDIQIEESQAAEIATSLNQDLSHLNVKSDNTAAPAYTADMVLDFIKRNGKTIADPQQRMTLFKKVLGHIPEDLNEDQLHSVEKMNKSMFKLESMMDTEEIGNIASVDDLYNYLAKKVYQLELRGKIKTMAGGNGAVSTKALSFPLALDPGTISLTLPLRGELKAGKIRYAVFEIGFSTTGFEIFVGSETRKFKGGGIGVGVNFGYEWLLSSGIGIDKTYTSEKSDTEGVWLRLPRNGDDEATREEALIMLETLLKYQVPASMLTKHLDQHEHTNPEPQSEDYFFTEDGNRPVLPKRIGALLMHNPNLSINVVENYHEEQSRNEASANATLLKTGFAYKSIPSVSILSVGVKSERRNKAFILNDKSGFMQITRSNALSGGSAFWQMGLLSLNTAETIAATEASNGDTGVTSKTGQNLTGINLQRQFKEKGVDVKLRYVKRDGQTNPVDTRIDFEDLHFKNHQQRVNTIRDELIDLGVEQLFKPKKGEEAKTDTIPLAEKRRIAEAWLDATLAQVEQQSNNKERHVFSLSYCLKPGAAALIDALNCKATLVRAHAKDDDAKALEEQIDQILKDPSSFKPWKVTTSERTSESLQRGFNFGVTWASLRKTEGQRGTNSYPA